MTPQEAFGQVLKQARKKNGISQEKLALNSDLDRTFISLIERGKRQPSLVSILLLSVGLGVPADELIKQTTDLIRKGNI